MSHAKYLKEHEKYQVSKKLNVLKSLLVAVIYCSLIFLLPFFIRLLSQTKPRALE